MIIHVRYTCNLNLDYIELFLAVFQNLEKLFTHLPTHVYFKHYPAVKKIRRGHDRMVVGILQVLQFPPPIKLDWNYKMVRWYHYMTKFNIGTYIRETYFNLWNI
jgi:hypothetical protein